MRKISLFAGIVAMTVGLAGVSTASSAFAMGCLNPDAGAIDLTHNAMNPGAGAGFDKEAVDAELAKGNRCSITQQSQPVNGDDMSNYRPSSSQTHTTSNYYN